MKKIIVAAMLFAGLFARATGAPSAINEKVLKAFKETFTAAQDVSWHEYDDYVQANFRQNEIQIRAVYNDEGELVRTTRYYGEANLLPTVTASLKKKYNGKEIFGVTEVSSSQEVTFVINLKDENNWYVVKSDVYGNLTQTDKFKRADK